MGETDSEQGIQQESRWSEMVTLRRWPLNKDLNLEAEAAQVSGNEDLEGETSRQTEQQMQRPWGLQDALGVRWHPQEVA